MIKYVAVIILILLADVGAGAQKKFVLNPDFKNNKSWKQIVKASVSFGNEELVMKQVFDLSMRATITEFKDNIPSKIEYHNVSGTQILYTNKIEKERYLNKDGKIVADITDSLLLVNAKDIGHLSDDILMVFPAGPFIGFVAKKGKLKVGAKWSSENILPLGSKGIKKNKGRFSEINGNFEILSVKQKKVKILWKGTAVYEKQSAKVEWERSIEYNVQKQRFISNTGALQIKGADFHIIYQIEITAEY